MSILSFHTSLGITDSYVTAKHPIKTYCNEKKAEKEHRHRDACAFPRAKGAQPSVFPPTSFTARRINEQGDPLLHEGLQSARLVTPS